MPPSDASDFYRWLWLCYDAGRAHERGERPLASDDDAAIVRLVASDWTLRMERHGQVERRPAWLTQLLDDAPALVPWGET